MAKSPFDTSDEAIPLIDPATSYSANSHQHPNLSPKADTSSPLLVDQSSSGYFRDSDEINASARGEFLMADIESGRTGRGTSRFSKAGCCQFSRSARKHLSRGVRMSSRACSLLKWHLIALFTITTLVLSGLALSHAYKVNAPEAYARQALSLNFTSVSVSEISMEGVMVHVVGDVEFDSSRVEDKITRILGRIATTIMQKAEVADTSLYISRVLENSAPDSPSLQLFGRASVPSTIVDLRDHHPTHLDFISSVEDIAAVSEIANLVEEYLNGGLAGVKFRGDADLEIRSGILPLGTHHVAPVVQLSSGDRPALDFAITVFRLTDDPNGGINALVAGTAHNPYPLQITVPAIQWLVEFPACNPLELSTLAAAKTEALLVNPYEGIDVRVSAVVRAIPTSFMEICPSTGMSAINTYLAQYIAGESVTLYVRGRPAQYIPNFPPWIADMLSNIAIPVPVPARESDGTGQLLKSYGLTRVKMNRGADGVPRLSALVNAIVALPSELEFEIEINNLRGISDMIYEGHKFGVLEIAEWAAATSFYTPEGYIQVVAEITDVPIDITDQLIFRQIMQQMFFGDVNIDIVGTIDVMLDTPVGYFVVNQIPASGTVALRSFSSFLDDFAVKNTIQVDDEFLASGIVDKQETKSYETIIELPICMEDRSSHFVCDNFPVLVIEEPVESGYMNLDSDDSVDE
ncbi:uncharacterized protein V1516DRAFT_672137 [Lipomyces oligophaga]|uniref:uncharacterized protein n=1 Tax=Lipomyces oligophaga TaxID=45792 RepID=UPI0034CFAE79